ncbi:MAG: hypothetical protein K6F53_01165 [Lachnospiraceae bacterium]|nr:hypothetical protein [Lachnospiraceae bacterium]
MASRPVFRAIETAPYFKKEETEFQFYSGFSVQQKQRSIQSLHASFRMLFPESRILEISSKSPEAIGNRLSAFNLSVVMKSGKIYSVEQLFQSAKTFENGGPYTDILQKSPRDAKKDSRLFDSGRLVCFKLGELEFPLEPKTYFYNWLYVNALAKDPELSKAILSYNAFTDIEFNPQRSINCQAEAAAVYTGLCMAGKEKEALKDKESFLKIVYQRNDEDNDDDNDGDNDDDNDNDDDDEVFQAVTYEQMSLTDLI